MSRYLGIIIGAALIAAAILYPPIAGVAMNVALENFFAYSGLSMTLGGLGTLFTKGPLAGLGTATRNPTAPWSVVYGRSRPGGTLVWTDTAA
jgi:predicted phage tail protein